MRIWCQCNLGIGTSKALNPYKESMERHARKVCRPDTVCEFHGQDRTFPGADRSRIAWQLQERGIIRNAIRAEKQGFDAFVMVSTTDQCFREISEMVNIPAVFITQATLHFTLLLAPNFAFISHNPFVYRPYPELAERYGLASKLVPGGWLDLSYTEFAELYQTPQPFIDSFMRKAREIVGRGATTLYPVGLPLSQWLIDQNIREVDGAAVLDPLGIALKTTELVLDMEKMGIKRVRIGEYTLPPENIRQTLRQEYQD